MGGYGTFMLSIMSLEMQGSAVTHGCEWQWVGTKATLVTKVIVIFRIVDNLLLFCDEFVHGHSVANIITVHASVELVVTKMHAYVYRNRDWLQARYDSIMPYLIKTYPSRFPKEKHTFASFSAAYQLIQSRCYSTGDSIAMLPFADLISHRSGSPSDYGVDLSHSMFRLHASECHDPGAEVFESYGTHHSSYHFLSTYGFIPEGHEHGDYIAILLPADVALKHAPPTAGIVGQDGRIVPESFIHSVADVMGEKNPTSLAAAKAALQLVSAFIRHGFGDHAGRCELRQMREGADGVLGLLGLNVPCVLLPTSVSQITLAAP